LSLAGTRTVRAIAARSESASPGAAVEAAARRAADAVAAYAQQLASAERPRRLGLSKQIVISAALLRRFAPELDAEGALKAAARLVQIQRNANAATVKKCVSEARALLAWLEAEHGMSLAAARPGDHHFIVRLESALDTATTDEVVLRRARELGGVRGGRPKQQGQQRVIAEVQGLIRRAGQGDAAAAQELSDIARLLVPGGRFCLDHEVPAAI
jgi:hypothetical protein